MRGELGLESRKGGGEGLGYRLKERGPEERSLPSQRAPFSKERKYEKRTIPETASAENQEKAPSASVSRKTLLGVGGRPL